MIVVTEILGFASDPGLSDRLHRLSHEGGIEYLMIDQADALRHRLRGTTTKGTDIAIALDRTEHLADGAVLLLEESRAVVVRTSRLHWLRIEPRDMAAALEVAYFAGNLHWHVRFEQDAVLVGMDMAPAHYLDRLGTFIETGRIRTSVQ